jgi:hypothetical protein
MLMDFKLLFIKNIKRKTIRKNHSDALVQAETVLLKYGTATLNENSSASFYLCHMTVAKGVELSDWSGYNST